MVLNPDHKDRGRDMIAAINSSAIRLGLVQFHRKEEQNQFIRFIIFQINLNQIKYETKPQQTK